MSYVQVGQFIDMAHLVLEDLPRAAVDCGRFTLLRTEGTPPPSLCSVSALSLELSAVCEVCTYVRTYVHCMLSVIVCKLVCNLYMFANFTLRKVATGLNETKPGANVKLANLYIYIHYIVLYVLGEAED